MGREKFYKVGDAIESFQVDNERNVVSPENKTVIEIVPKPSSSKQVKDLINQLFDKYHAMKRFNITVIDGENLADDPRVAPRVNKNAIYVLEV